MLTPKQCRLLYFIHDYMRQSGGTAPSFATMAEGIGLRSKSGIYRLVSGLAERGFIVRRPRLARAIEIVRMPSVPVAASANDLKDLVERMCSEHGIALVVMALSDIAHELTERQQDRILANVNSVGSA